MRSPSSTERDALRDLSARYASAVDRRDRDRLLGAFHADAELVVVHDDEAEPIPLRGHGQIGRIVERIARYRTTFHVVGQSSYEVGADSTTATGEVYCIAHHLSEPATAATGDADATDQVLLVRYLDDYRTDDAGAWKISHRTVRVDGAVVHPMPATATTTMAATTPATETTTGTTTPATEEPR